MVEVKWVEWRGWVCSSACSKDDRQNVKEPLFTGMGEPWGLLWSPQTTSSSSISCELVQHVESQSYPRSAESEFLGNLHCNKPCRGPCAPEVWEVLLSKIPDSGPLHLLVPWPGCSPSCSWHGWLMFCIQPQLRCPFQKLPSPPAVTGRVTPC